jgi:hypothetical protein
VLRTQQQDQLTHVTNTSTHSPSSCSTQPPGDRAARWRRSARRDPTPPVSVGRLRGVRVGCVRCEATNTHAMNILYCTHLPTTSCRSSPRRHPALVCHLVEHVNGVARHYADRHVPVSICNTYSPLAPGCTSTDTMRPTRRSSANESFLTLPCCDHIINFPRHPRTPPPLPFHCASRAAQRCRRR